MEGGLNLYGFANGDPVNFADPFGLCPIETDGIPCAVTYATVGAGIGAGVATLSTGACAVGTFGVCGFAAPGTIAAGAAAGGFIGGLVGSAIDSRDAVALQMGRVSRWIRRVIAGIGIGAGQGLSEEQQRLRDRRPREEQVQEDKAKRKPGGSAPPDPGAKKP